MDVIRLKDTTKTYRIGEVETRALDGVSIEFGAGEFTALVGPSGSGKTTMLQLIGCLDKPSSGKVFIHGEDVGDLNANKRAELRSEQIGFIFQFFALIPVLNAYENVELPLLLAGVPSTERRERVTSLLEAVGLADRMQHRPNQMSGGQQQRVAIARALITNPEIILADEPTGALDRKSGLEVMAIFKKLHQQGRRTIILVTHDRTVAEHAQRIIVLDDGKIAEDGAAGKQRDPDVELDTLGAVEDEK